MLRNVVGLDRKYMTSAPEPDISAAMPRAWFWLALLGMRLL